MNQFSKAEFDFSDVTKSELLACYFYEYARESRAARSEIAVERRQRLQRKGKPGQVRFGSRVRNLVQSHILMSVSLSSGFPNTPWRCLSDKDKQIPLKMVAQFPKVLRYFLTWNNPPLSFALNESGTTTLDMWKQQYRERLPAVSNTDSIKFGFFAVNLKYGHPVLLEEFGGYLRHFVGKPMFEFPPVAKRAVRDKPLGRKSLRDALNALGAMRLRYYCQTFSEAQEKMKSCANSENGTAPLFYADRRDFNVACTRAIASFQKLYGWLDSELPIHHTKGWAK